MSLISANLLPSKRMESVDTTRRLGTFYCITREGIQTIPINLALIVLVEMTVAEIVAGGVQQLRLAQLYWNVLLLVDTPMTFQSPHLRIFPEPTSKGSNKATPDSSR